jgi:hypothetical protein
MFNSLCYDLSTGEINNTFHMVGFYTVKINTIILYTVIFYKVGQFIRKLLNGQNLYGSKFIRAKIYTVIIDDLFKGSLQWMSVSDERAI